MDKYIEGIKGFFKIGKEYSPLSFNFFLKSWFSQNTKFIGYNQSNFSLYLEFSQRRDDSDLFVFSQSVGVDVYKLKRLEDAILKIDLVDKRDYPLSFPEFCSRNRRVFSKNFKLSLKDELFLSEKITCALYEMGLHKQVAEVEYAATSLKSGYDEISGNRILDLGEGIILYLQ